MLAAALLDAGRFDQAAAHYREARQCRSKRRARLVRPRHELPGPRRQRVRPAAEGRIRHRRTCRRWSPIRACRRRQYRSAFFFYNEALKQLPNLHGIHAALADVYRKTGHPDWAAAEDAKEAALPAADCKAHPAECEFVAGHDVAADDASARRAPSPRALYWQAKAANELALQAFFRLGQLPPSVELHQLKAEIARGQGQHLESVQEWRAALALSPGNPRIERELAVSLFMAADYRGGAGRRRRSC